MVHLEDATARGEPIGEPVRARVEPRAEERELLGPVGELLQPDRVEALRARLVEVVDARGAPLVLARESPPEDGKEKGPKGHPDDARRHVVGVAEARVGMTSTVGAGSAGGIGGGACSSALPPPWGVL